MSSPLVIEGFSRQSVKKKMQKMRKVLGDDVMNFATGSTDVDELRQAVRVSVPSSFYLRRVGRARAASRMADGLLEAVRGLWLANPELGPRPLLTKLREQQPDLGVGNKEVREALTALKAEESEATEAAAAALTAAAAPPTADEGITRLPASLAPSLACFGCARLPSDMDDGREKHLDFRGFPSIPVPAA